MSEQKNLLECLDESEIESKNESKVKKKLKEMGEIITGNTPSTKEEDNYGGEIPFVRAKDINKGAIITETEKNITEKGLKEVGEHKLLPENSIMITCIGANLGAVGISGIECLTNQQINSIITSDKSDEWYLYYKLISNKKKLRNYAGGSAQPILSKSKFGNVELDVHPYEKQKQISSILRELDKKIELNTRINKILKKIAQAIFKEWFVDFGPYEEFKDSELGKIPKEFEVKKLKEIMELEYGKGLPEREREGTRYPVYGSNGQVGTHKEKLVEGPGIIVGRKGTIGTVTLCMDDFWPIDTTFYVAPKRKFDILYYYHLLKQSIEFGHLGSDSAVPGLNRNIALDQKVIIPPKEESEQFTKLIKDFYEKKKNLTGEKEKISIIRDTLLPKLMSGEIRVNDLDIK